MKKGKAKYRTAEITIRANKTIKVYAHPKVYDALKELEDDLDLYHGVRMIQVVEAVYKQGQKDGANVAFAALRDGLHNAEQSIAHKKPGRPKKRLKA